MLGTLLPTAAAQDTQDFPTCLAGLKQAARSAGLPSALLDRVIDNLEFQPRVIELDRAQPEFRRSFSAYFKRRVTDARIEQGRRLRAEKRRLLERLTREYGVPGHYLLAFWGLETNFGGYLGKQPTLDSLATLACDQRRSDFFRGEFLLAMHVLNRESLEAGQMRGSWAGAVGHMQFMPSSYFAYALDGDGDGQVDLWGSEADALASGANFLNSLGWQRGERWGREVRLPDDFDYALTGRDRDRPISEWRAMGVRQADGRELPDAEMRGAILVPMGHSGPAFLVYRNFQVIMRWNRSESYAVAVGHLADRIAGAGGLTAPLPEVEYAPDAETVRQLQARLLQLGFEAGKPDGIFGPATRAAVRDYQASIGRIADGYPDNGTLAAAGILTTER
jgi:membrane-bound lytic murein transglycosylase B